MVQAGGMNVRRILLLSLLALAPAAFGQDPAGDPVARNLAALAAVAEPMEAALAEIDSLTAARERAPGPDQRSELEDRIEAERERVRQFRDRFRDLVGGSEAAAFEPEAEAGSSLQDQFSDLLEPLLGALREPTARMRQAEAMRTALAGWSDRAAKAAVVVARIDSLLARSPRPAIKAELETARRLWAGREAEAASQARVLRLQIEEHLQNSPTLWQGISSMFGGFWKNRGLSLLAALAAAVAGFIATRRLYLWARRFSPLHRGRGLWSRAADVLAAAAAGLVAVLGALLVFYARGDWLMLTLAALLLFGAAWAGKTALPPYLEQIRLLLNLGTVREGERVIYRGLPWRVEVLGFHTLFHNPELAGGKLRVPIRELADMISRRADPGEPWFPTSVGDWILLEPGHFGKIAIQTPEQVVVEKPGGSRLVVPATAFLADCPENLSRGFRIVSRFGIDYRHQADATGLIPETLAADLRAALAADSPAESPISLKVELAAAGPSALEFAVLADFAGNQAARLRELDRRLHALCIDACNRHGWTIPFTQITVHQARDRDQADRAPPQNGTGFASG
jgi:hypothetical protein